MTLSLLLLTAAAAQADPDIIVTAGRVPVPEDTAPVSSTILGEVEIEALDLPAA